jgi:hypothetical protein
MRDPAPLDPRPRRLSSAAGAVLGIAIALLLAILPAGDDHAPRLQSAFGATTHEQCLAVADRVSEARRGVQGARRADIDHGSVLLPAGIALPCPPPSADSAPPSLALAEAPAGWRNHAQARAPPRA